MVVMMVRNHVLRKTEIPLGHFGIPSTSILMLRSSMDHCIMIQRIKRLRHNGKRGNIPWAVNVEKCSTCGQINPHKVYVPRTLAVSSLKLQVPTWEIQGTCLHRSARKFSSQRKGRTSAEVCEMVKQNKRSSGRIFIKECREAISWNSYEKWSGLGRYIPLLTRKKGSITFTILFFLCKTVVKVLFTANM